MDLSRRSDERSSLAAVPPNPRHEPRDRWRPTARSRPADLRPRAPGPGAFQDHLPALVTVAWFLLDDPILVTEALVQAVREVSEGRVPPSDGRRRSERIALATVVHRCCAEITDARDGPPAAGRTSPVPDQHRGQAELSPEERSALALVAFGGHTYTEAADVLGAAPQELATRLRDGLHHLPAPPTAATLGRG